VTGRLYHLAARDGSGVFLGLDLVQCLLIGGGFVGTVALRLGELPVALAAVPLLVAFAVSKVSVAGRPLCRWFPLVGSAVMGWVSGSWRWRGSLPLLPNRSEDEVDMPPVLRGIDVVELGDGADRIAVARDRRNARLTAVLPVGGADFAGAAPDQQDALLAGWGQVLAAHAGRDAGVVQIGWSHQARPSSLDAHRRWAAELAGMPGGGGAAGPEYDALVDEVEQQAATHETVVWVTVAGAEIAGRGRLLDRAAMHVPAAVGGLARGLSDAGLTVGSPLPVQALWRLLRLRCDPAPAARAGSALSLAQRTGVLGPVNGRPLAFETGWSSVRIDGAIHRAYWVESWPRRPVPAGWLQVFLAGCESTVMTVVHRPVDPARSNRRIDSQLVKLGAHRARKEQKSRRVTEADRRAEQAVFDLEGELASGYAETAYLGLVTVTATGPDDLEDQCDRVERAARSAQLGLRVLHGRQDVAWAASLPLGLTEPGLLELVGL
jgi:hypothetical protein